MSQEIASMPNLSGFGNVSDLQQVMQKDTSGKLKKLIEDYDIEAVLISSKYSLRYFTGFTGTTGIALAFAEKRFFFTDFRYVVQAKEQVEPNGFTVVKVERGAIDTLAEYKFLPESSRIPKHPFFFVKLLPSLAWKGFLFLFEFLLLMSSIVGSYVLRTN